MRCTLITGVVVARYGCWLLITFDSQLFTFIRLVVVAFTLPFVGYVGVFVTFAFTLQLLRYVAIPVADFLFYVVCVAVVVLPVYVICLHAFAFTPRWITLPRLLRLPVHVVRTLICYVYVAAFIRVCLIVYVGYVVVV